MRFLGRFFGGVDAGLVGEIFGAEVVAVSYTHLTLPTSDLVEISVVAVSLKEQHFSKAMPGAYFIHDRDRLMTCNYDYRCTPPTARTGEETETL